MTHYRQLCEAIILALYAVFLLYRGFGSRAGFATWHMFAGVSFCRFECRALSADGAETDFNPWEYLPHTQLNMDAGTLKLFLAYLERVKGLKLRGRVHLREGRRTQIITLS